MMRPETVNQLRSGFRGQIVTREDVAYDAGRKVYNAMIDRKPLAIARCADVADVIAAVRFAREHSVRVSVRGGGHNAAGLGVCDDGLVIDLSGISYVHVEPSSRMVRVGGGATWGAVDHAAHVFGLAVPSGAVSTTGVGGLTLGGGLGHLTRKYGLTIDSLVSADLILADGSFAVASAQANPDLFWAIRGGGGNFGIVTSFLFQAHPVNMVCAGPMLWDLDAAPDLMKWYREFILDAPEDINGFFAFMTVPPGPPFPPELHFRKMCGIVWCFTTSIEKASDVLDPIRGYRPPAFEFVVPMPFPTLQSMFDGLYPPGLHWYWKAGFFNEISDEAIAAHVRFAVELPTLHSTMHLYPVNGAAHRIAREDTAWSYRDAVWSQVIVGVDPDTAKTDSIVHWAREYWSALHPLSAGGGYINFMMDEGEQGVRATYRDNYGRLAVVKAKYDPENFFSVNQNIKPAASSATVWAGSVV
jgi:FAD/FMN-containing dehydrogenase